MANKDAAIGKPINEVVTPAFIISLPILTKNTSNMIENAKRLGVELRPHVKTHKTKEGLKYQLGKDYNKIVVSTLKEAEFFATEVKDILYAVPISLEKLPKIKELSEKVKIHILVDHPFVLEGVSKFARQNKCKLSVFLKLDGGYGRAGFPINEDIGINLAKSIVNDEFLTFQGIYVHAGHSYDSKSVEDIEKFAEQERQCAIQFKQKLLDNGITPTIVSVGSTPTCSKSKSFEGCTEMHPGNYIFYDCQQVAAHSANWEDCAGMVYTSVISHYPDRNRALVDGGGLSFSKDLSPFPGFGKIIDHPELVLKKVSQEVGILERVDGKAIDEKALPIGTKLKVIPNHVCLAAACFEKYYVVNNEDIVVDVWYSCR